jgi:hypothetical protein
MRRQKDIHIKSRSIENEVPNDGNDFYYFEMGPNPALSFTMLDLEEVNGKTVKIEVFNSLGGFVKSIPMDRVSERFLSNGLKNLSGGIYQVRMQVDDTYIVKS